MFYTNRLKRLAYLNQKCARRLKWECGDCKERSSKYKMISRKKKVCFVCGSDNIHPYHSNNWKKAKYTLAKFHEHLKNKRDNFLWLIARHYAEKYDIITVPNWPLKKQIEYAVDNKTAIRLTDGAYGKFVKMLEHKCNEFDSQLIIAPEDKIMKEIIKKLDYEKKMLKKVKIVLSIVNSKIRRELK